MQVDAPPLADDVLESLGFVVSSAEQAECADVEAPAQEQKRRRTRLRNISAPDANTQAELAIVSMREAEALREAERQRVDVTSTLRESELMCAEVRFLYLFVLAATARSFGRPFTDINTLVAHKHTLLESPHLHDCMSLRTCEKRSLECGEWFFDAARHCKLRATGRVYVCTTSGRAHMCPGTDACVLSTMSEDRTEWRCMFSGRSLGAILSSHVYGDLNAEADADSRRMRDTLTDTVLHELDVASASTSVASSPSGGNSAKRRRVRVRKPPANDTHAFQTVVRRRLHTLLFSEDVEEYWEQLRERTLVAANAACESELRQCGGALPTSVQWVVALGAFMRIANKVPVQRALFGSQPRALATLAEQTRCLDYFVECLTHVAQLLRSSPRMRTNNVPLPNFAIGVLYRLSMGYEMSVSYHRETRRLLYNVPASQMPAAELVCSERVQFLPAHGFLRVRLPDNTFAKRKDVLTGNITVVRLINDISACYCALLTPERTIDEVRSSMCLQQMMPLRGEYAREDLVVSLRAPGPK